MGASTAPIGPNKRDSFPGLAEIPTKSKVRSNEYHKRGATVPSLSELDKHTRAPGELHNRQL